MNRRAVFQQFQVIEINGRMSQIVALDTNGMLWHVTCFEGQMPEGEAWAPIPMPVKEKPKTLLEDLLELQDRLREQGRINDSQNVSKTADLAVAESIVARGQ